jgi:hypothetical protein
MKGIEKDILPIWSAVMIAPPECSECVAFCAEVKISCECRGDFHPKTCEHSSCYELESEVQDAVIN